MTETLVGMGPLEMKAGKKTASPGDAERAAVRELVKAARARGEDLTGPDGLLKTITATVLESALEEEMTEHLGYDKHHPLGHVGGGNIRNGTRSKTVLTEAAGEVPVQVPRDRAGTFEPVVVRKRQRRLSDVDAVAISLYAKGLTAGEIGAHFQELYGASVSKDTVSRITDRVIEDMQAWCSGPLLAVYAAIFIDAIYVKVRDGQVGNQPFHAAIGVDLDGHWDVLGLWAGHGGGESANGLASRGDAISWAVCSASGLPGVGRARAWFRHLRVPCEDSIPSEECRRSWLYSSIQVATRVRAWSLVAKCSSWRSSNSTVECQLSVTALSSAEPARPIDCLIPTRAQAA